MDPISLLIIEDADTLREVLANVLACEGFNPVTAKSGEEALEIIKTQEFHCILSDFKLPGLNGIQVLSKIRDTNREVPFLIMTAYGSIDIAVEAMKLGANDFITKPFEPDELKEKLNQVVKYKQILNRTLGRETRRGRRFATQDHETLLMLEKVKKAARVDSTVFLNGESGSGKELMARFIHEHSARNDKSFIAVNCAAMPDNLLESEFFGHEAGAFTGATQTRIGVLELASEGTLFLDEISEMSPMLQVKLLRAIQEREIRRVGGSKTIKINPRIIAATNRDFETAVEEGHIREDLYYRLAVITFTLPPLRERKDDILPLANYFLTYFSAAAGREVLQLAPESEKLLLKYPWPGNVRELENVIERAVLLAGDKITPEHLGISLNLNYDLLQEAACTLPEIAAQAVQKAEIDVIAKVLRQSKGNKSEAARVLGVSYKTLLNKIKDYGLAGSSNSIVSPESNSVNHAN
jgi:DNA-binding NtrC family response regulator